jgi:ADP-ribosylglycohydrolase
VLHDSHLATPHSIACATMLGAIAGDIIGSVFERDRATSLDFPLFTRHSQFTDDTVLTVATAHALLTGEPYADVYHRFGNAYPHAGYGGTFRRWLRSADKQPYNSWGNGSAMRVSPIGLAAQTAEWALSEAARSAEVTHNHPEGIKGAQAVALAVYLAKLRTPKEEIRREVTAHTGYYLARTVADIRETYRFDVSCAGSVPEAIIAFLEARDTEHAIRLAIWLGGDADTQAAIAGGIAEAFWGPLPETIRHPIEQSLDADLLSVVRAFQQRFPTPG